MQVGCMTLQLSTARIVVVHFITVGDDASDSLRGSTVSCNRNGVM